MPEALIIYHADCTDGACAAWGASFHVARAEYSCTLIPAAPNECPAEAFAHSWDLVLIVDMCPPLSALQKLAQSSTVWVLDHHKTNREVVEAWPRHVYDDARSGAGLAWDEVPAIVGAPRLPRPWFVDYIEDRDLWRWAMPDSREINAALCFGPRTPGRIAELIWSTARDALVQGRTILSVQSEAIKQAVKHATVAAGFAFVTSPNYQSEIGSALTAKHGVPAVVWYTREADAGPVAQVSFRSRDDLRDVSAVAARFGGGGHRNAAGAVVPLGKWMHEVARVFELPISQVVVQTAVRSSGVHASLEVDALGPVIMPGYEPCCDNEQRSMAGGCMNCGAPCL